MFLIAGLTIWGMGRQRWRSVTGNDKVLLLAAQEHFTSLMIFRRDCARRTPAQASARNDLCRMRRKSSHGDIQGYHQSTVGFHFVNAKPGDSLGGHKGRIARN